MAEDFRDRLRRLRRDEDAAAPPPARRGAGMPGWLRDRLERQRARDAGDGLEHGTRELDGAAGPAGGLRRTRAVARSSGPGSGRSGPGRSGPSRPRTSGEPRDLAVRTRAEGVFAERVILRQDTERHGTWRLADVDGAGDFDLVARDPALADLAPRRAVYLDIETTGLSGGAGTWPFLVALGRYTDDGAFELWQGFLREPGEERAMLAEVADRIAAGDAVVSFFGKAFDKTRLEDKLRQHRLPSPFPDRPHLDLYHPLNRLYTRRAQWERLASPAAGRVAPPPGAGFGDGRLCTMETELCGLVRDDDLPGSFAPEAWFDFLADRPHLLEAIFDHNADDVWSLATLTAHLGRTLAEAAPDGAPLAGPCLARALGVASLYRDRADRTAERAWLDRARARLEGAEPRGLALWRADAARLAGDKAGALAMYDDLAGDDDALGPRLHLERAKLLEHHARDHAGALAACEAARAAALRFLGGRASVRFLADLDHRAERLRGKLAAGGA